MSILKFINGKNKSLLQLKNLIDYIANPEKAPEKYLAHTGLCGRSTYQDMFTFKLLHGKMKGRQYVHFILSFDSDVSCEKAYQVGTEVLTYFKGQYQVFMAVHVNTKNVHCHYILNTVGFDGYKFRQSISELKMLREFVNIILIKFNLNPVGKIRRSGREWFWEEENFYNGGYHFEYEDMGEDDELEAVYRPIWYEDEKTEHKLQLIKYEDKKTKHKLQLIRYEDEKKENQQFRPIRFLDEE